MKHPIRQNILSTVIFGTTGIIRKAIPIGTGLIAFLRGLFGGLFLFIYSLFKKEKSTDKIRGKLLIKIMITGVLIGLNWVFLFEAYNYTSIPIATLLYYMAPVFVTILSTIFLKEKITTKKGICVLIALLGMFLISGVIGSTDRNISVIGVTLSILGAITYAIAVICNKKIVGVDPVKKTTIQLLTVAVVMLPYVLLSKGFILPKLTFNQIILLAIICIVNTGIAYLLYFATYDKLPAQTIAILSYIDPIVTLILSYLVYKELLDIYGIIGMLLILGSAIVSEYTFKKEKE